MRSIRVLAVAAVTTAVAAIPAAGAGAATLHPTKELRTPTVTVTTSTGAKVQLSIDMMRGGGAMLDVDLSKGTRNYAEDHDWSFDVDGSILSYRDGKGTLLTGKQLGPYGSLRLTFTKVAQATRSCRNDNGALTKVTSVKASIKGVVAFKARSSNTQASKLGTVRRGAASAPYHFGGRYAHYISTTNGSCGLSGPPMSGTPDCISGTFWSGPMAGSSTLRVVSGGSEQGFGAEIVGTRLVSLSYPANAMRMDFIGVNAPDPVMDTSGANPVLSVTTNPTGPATGSATLTATAAPTSQPSSACKAGSTTQSQDISDYESAAYENGSSPLTVASLVGSDITVPNSPDQAAFTDFSYS